MIITIVYMRCNQRLIEFTVLRNELYLYFLLSLSIITCIFIADFKLAKLTFYYIQLTWVLVTYYVTKVVERSNMSLPFIYSLRVDNKGMKDDAIFPLLPGLSLMLTKNIDISLGKCCIFTHLTPF